MEPTLPSATERRTPVCRHFKASMTRRKILQPSSC